MSGLATANETARFSIVGVSAASARVWVQNARDVVDRLDEQRATLPFAIGDDVFFELRRFLADVERRAQAVTFRMVDEYEVARLKRLVTYWFNITSLDETTRARLGVSWTPPEGRAFADALAASVASTMTSCPDLAAFADRLAAAWATCQPSFAGVVAGSAQPAAEAELH